MSRLMPALHRLAAVLPALAVAALATLPAVAQVSDAEPPTRVSPDGKLEVQLVVGPHGAVGRRGPGLPDGPGCAVQRLTILPGGGVPEHIHATSDETVVILQGGGTFTLDGKPIEVRAGSTVFVPMGRKHAFASDPVARTIAFQVYDPAGPEARFTAWPARGVRPAAQSPAPGKKPE